MIPAITLFSIVKYLNKLNVKRIKKIRDSNFGFREILLSTEYGTLSIFYNYKSQSLILSTAKITPSSSQHPIIKAINKELANGIVEEIAVQDFERIMLLKIKKNAEYTLIIEIFGKGNTILVDKNNRIKLLEHGIKTKYRTLSVKGTYEPPKSDKIDPLNIFNNEYLELIKQRMTGKKIKEVYKIINLDKYTITELLHRAGLNASYSDKILEENEVVALYHEIKRIINEAASCNTFSIIKNKTIVLLPFKVYSTGDAIVYTDAIDACNQYLEQILLKNSSVKSKEANKLQKQILKLSEKKNKLQVELSLLEEFVPSLYSRIDELTHIFDKITKGEKISYRVDKREKVLFLPVSDELSVKIKYDIPPVKAINLLYETEIKPRKRGLEKIRNKIDELRRKLTEKGEQLTRDEIKLEYKILTKREWFEAYRWFYTSNGLLVIGGKDARSNRKIIRKHLENNDLVFHADYYGSPFVILKNGRNASKLDILETAIFTASYSRAWRDGLSVVDVYYVSPEQISEKPPSGEYIKKGAFMVYGKKNYVKKIPLELCLSFDKQLKKLIIGPCSAIARKDVLNKIFLIYPGVKPKGKVVKWLSELIIDDIAGETGLKLSMHYLVNTINSILPSGGFNIKIVSKNLLVD